MEKKALQVLNEGMIQDTSISKIDNKFAFENINIRITASEQGSLLTVTNERGHVQSENIETGLEEIPMFYLGHALVENSLILFGISDADVIERLDFNPDGSYSRRTLFKGNLNFSKENPIETLVSIETADCRKVYWADGRNITRFINIEQDRVESTDLYNGFDFLPDANLSDISGDVVKTYDGSGMIPAGAYQYFLTFYNKRGAQTGIVWASDLVFASFRERGGNPGELTPTRFSISFTGLDSSFEYARLYCYSRTSEETSAHAYIVGDSKIENGSASFIDNGTDLTDIDPYEILFLGGQEFIASTLTQKNGKLFLGNIRYKEAENLDRLEQAVTSSRETVIEGAVSYQSSSVITFQSKAPDSTRLAGSGKSRGFLRGNLYRFGIQFLKDNTSSSRVWWLGDNLVEGNAVLYDAVLDSAKASDILNEAKALGYTNYRLLYVKPSASDRLVVCQGVLNPTVFNAYNRFNNTEHALASWVTRPINGALEYNHYRPLGAASTDSGEIQSMDYDTPPSLSVTDILDGETASLSYNVYVKLSASRKVHNGTITRWARNFSVVLEIRKTAGGQTGIVETFGDNLSFRIHPRYENETIFNYFGRSKASSEYEKWHQQWMELVEEGIDKYDIPITVEEIRSAIYANQSEISPSGNKNARNWNVPNASGDLSNTKAFVADALEKMKSDFFIDESIVTMNTPDLPDSVSNTVLSISGMAPVDYTSMACRISADNIYSSSGGRRALRNSSAVIGNSALWADAQYAEERKADSSVPYFVYLWQNSSSIPNFTKDDKSYSVIDSKLFAYRTVCKDPLWFEVPKRLMMNDSKVSYNSAEILDGALYLRDVDTVAVPASDNGTIQEYRIYTESMGEHVANGDKAHSGAGIRYRTNPGIVMSLDNPLPRINSSNPAITDSVFDLEASVSTRSYTILLLSDFENGEFPSEVFEYTGITLDETLHGELLGKLLEDDFSGKVYIARSSEDIVPELYLLRDDNHKNYDVATDYEEGTQDPVYSFYLHKDSLVPVQAYENMHYSILDLTGQASNEEVVIAETPSKGQVFQALKTVSATEVKSEDSEESEQDSDDTTAIYTDSARIKDYQTSPYLFIGELRKPLDGTEYGGSREESVQNDTFTVISPITALGKDCITNDGDAYFQQYEFIKAYPYSSEDMNQVLDICSVRLASYQNLDGRYDREKEDLLTIDWNNFAPLNPAYNSSSILTGNILDDRFRTGDYGAMIAHSLVKTPNSEVDTWSNINLSATVELNSHYGNVNALRNLNGNIYAFQDNAISQILYDERTQLSTNVGTPVEIANSLTVSHHLLTDKYGSRHKRSIVSAKTGLYFYDFRNGIIASLGEGIQPLSTQKGFDKWVRSAESYRGFYDNRRGDIYYIQENSTTDTPVVCYNEFLGQFTSFYRYKEVNLMENIHDELISFKGNRIWTAFKGKYNLIYGNTEDSLMRYRITPDPYGDKIFTNLDYRCDFFENKDDDYHTYLPDRTLDSIEVSNEYQYAKASPKVSLQRLWTGVGKRFRLWKMDIPRDQSGHGRKNFDRIRNPWINLRLTMKGKDEKMDFHNLNVIYYE